MSSRIERLRARMSKDGLSTLLVTKPEHVYYLSGFSGSSGVLLVDDARVLLLSDFRYVLQAAEEAAECEFVCADCDLFDFLRGIFSDFALREIGVEAAHLSLQEYQQLGSGDSTVSYTLRPTTGIIEDLRRVKEPDELARIREAVRLTDGAYGHLLKHVHPGVAERDLALEAEWYMRRHGADGLAFDIIVAAGVRSALPHAQPGDRPLQVGDLVVVDMGARFHRYCADMTRTFAVGKTTPVGEELYRICLQAQLEGVARITAGMTGREADDTVRSVITQAGYGEYFGHGTGHGVGLEIHESPRLGRHADDTLPVGAVVTVEPGIYLPEIGGVRIEDLGVLTPQGYEVFTATPKPDRLPVYG